VTSADEEELLQKVLAESMRESQGVHLGVSLPPAAAKAAASQEPAADEPAPDVLLADYTDGGKAGTGTGTDDEKAAKQEVSSLPSAVAEEVESGGTYCHFAHHELTVAARIECQLPVAHGSCLNDCSPPNRGVRWERV